MLKKIDKLEKFQIGPIANICKWKPKRGHNLVPKLGLL